MALHSTLLARQGKSLAPLWLVLLLILAAQGILAPTARGQESIPYHLAIIHAAPGKPQQDHLPLNVFFTVVDESGRPVAEPQIESASLQVLNTQEASAPPVVANVENPRTPIYVALLLDTSGSMVEAMPAMREAAKAAVAQAPPNVYFAVVPFDQVELNQELRPLTPFTNNRGAIQRDIDAIQATPRGPTCLYNAAYNAINLLNEQVQAPEERIAIILFTDGRDELASGEPCSRRTLEDVIYRARTGSEQLTPIFTVGLDEGTESRLDPVVLQTLATETRAYYAIGDSDALAESFRAIMGYLDSQLRASADVQPRLGPNEARLRVKLSDFDEPIVETFTFKSPVDFPTAVEPIAIQIQDFHACADPTQCWEAVVAINNPQAFSTVLFKVVDIETGTIYEFTRVPLPAMTVQLDAAPLERNREYRLEIYALDAAGNVIPPQVAEGEPRQDAQAVHRFKHRLPDPPPPLEFSGVTGHKVDWAARTISFTLGITEPQRLDKYQIGWLDANQQPLQKGKETVYQYNPQSAAPVIDEPMPSAMQQRTEVYTYTAIIDVWDKRGLPSQVRYTFVAVPPPPPPWWQWFADNIILLALLALALALAIVFVPKRQSQTPGPKDPHTPNGEPTPLSGPSLDGSMSLRVKLLRAPQMKQNLDQLVTKFPCTIGRAENCDVNLAAATPSRRISGRHLEVAAENGEFYLHDLDSTNGTVVNGQPLGRGSSVLMQGKTTVRLAKDVIIELRPESSHDL